MRQRIEFMKEALKKKNADQASITTKSSLHHKPPSPIIVFFLIFTARLLSALFSNISDCDETFNYWEPLHRLFHGHGFQTWEYSPTYAIRSYAYLSTLLAPLSIIHAFVTHDKVTQFYLLRVFLALVTSAVETFFHRSISRHHGASISNHLLLFLIISPAMFISSTAFLPSSFSMLLCMAAYASWWAYKSLWVSVLLVGGASLYGWPFAAIIGIPMMLDMVMNEKQLKLFIVYSFISLVLLLLPLTLFDSYLYGKSIIAPINIIAYNVFSGHGPNLYGTEPWHFYPVNLLLNFNLVFPLALLALPLFIFTVLPNTRINQLIAHPICTPLLVNALWMLVFFTRPHKEERFIFPIYPFIALSAAWCVDGVQKLQISLFSLVFPTHHTTLTSFFSRSLSLTFIIFSLSRILALYYGYHGALEAYGTFPGVLNRVPPVKNLSNPTFVCVGKEWYRFPSHFFLPQGYHLKFVRSEFKGQLPGEFSSAHNATRLLPPHVNDLNLEQPQRYVNLSTCDFLVDLDTPTHTALQPPYSSDHDNWRVVVSIHFLDASRSNSIFRAFYIPFISNHYTIYNNYHILARKDRWKNYE